MSANPSYSSPEAPGVRLGKPTVVDEALLRAPLLSRVQIVFDPNPAVNSWAPYSMVCPVMELDQVKVMVDAPVVVTVPNQSSSSSPAEPANCTPLVQVVTPPPEIDDTLGVVVDPASANTTSTSPTVWGDTARVPRPDPSLEVRLPTGVISAGAL